MSENELVPGLKLVPVYDPDAQNVDETIQKIAETKAANEVVLLRRTQQLKDLFMQSIYDGEIPEITQEMIDLGLEEEFTTIKGMAIYGAQFIHMCNDDQDDSVNHWN